MSRLTDRYAIAFLGVTLALAGAAWFLSGEWTRALAVLVVATPCPLILAVPVAIVSGMSLSARRGVLIKSANTLETLAQAKTLLIDKTGTLTHGRARMRIAHNVGFAGDDALLGMAASLGQASQHVISEALVDAARTRGILLTAPDEVVETPGEGLSGRVGRRQVAIGHPDYVERWSRAPSPALMPAMSERSSVAVGIDAAYAGTLVLADDLRPDAEATLRAFRAQGVQRIVLVTGDRAEVAEGLAATLPIDRIVSDATPADNVEAGRSESAAGATLMIGDGVDDAPALALADVGVALGGRGAAAASEAADAVVLVDRLDRIADSIRIARRTRGIALQSVIAGIGLSGVGMIAAALGYLPPVAGALAQEVIDVAVVLECAALPQRPGPRNGVAAGGQRQSGKRDQRAFRLRVIWTRGTIANAICAARPIAPGSERYPSTNPAKDRRNTRTERPISPPVSVTKATHPIVAPAAIVAATPKRVMQNCETFQLAARIIGASRVTAAVAPT